MTILLLIAVAFLAYSNGANDNFKGVASLFGSRICGYRVAISWAAVTTFVGSVAAMFLAQALLKKFSGKAPVAHTRQLALRSGSVSPRDPAGRHRA